MRVAAFGQAVALVGLGLLAGSPAFAQQDLKDDVEALKKGQQEILRQLQELKTLVQSQAQARPAAAGVKDVVFDLGKNPVKGQNSAKVTLIEFSDYQ